MFDCVRRCQSVVQSARVANKGLCRFSTYSLMALNRCVNKPVGPLVYLWVVTVIEKHHSQFCSIPQMVENVTIPASLMCFSYTCGDECAICLSSLSYLCQAWALLQLQYPHGMKASSVCIIFKSALSQSLSMLQAHGAWASRRLTNDDKLMTTICHSSWNPFWALQTTSANCWQTIWRGQW